MKITTDILPMRIQSLYTYALIATYVILMVLLPGDSEGNVQESVFNGKIEKPVTLKYAISLPDEYASNEQTRWPLILFLHGAGERGDDLSKIIRLGPMAKAQATPGFPFIVVAPLCPSGKAWSSDELAVLLDEVEKKYRVASNAIYLTGYSMGGAGTWALAMDYPERFAAIAPLCGRVIPLLAGRLYKTPIWVFHGEKDQVVPISQSREIVDWLKGINNNVMLTVYPDEGHEIWERVYSGSELYDWFMKWRKPAEDKPSGSRVSLNE